jgi:uracil-DNA glycosylase
MARSPPPDARPLIPARPTLTSLRQAAESCTACPLYRNATQTVFGAGPAGARVMLVGEQPGDAEDRAGLPFVGPAGRLLDHALEAAGIDRRLVYVTNAVKHLDSSAGVQALRHVAVVPFPDEAPLYAPHALVRQAFDALRLEAQQNGCG